MSRRFYLIRAVSPDGSGRCYTAGMDHVFVLLEDTDMTLRSAPEPTGVAVTTEEEAQRWTSAGTYRAYCRVTIRERAADVAGRASDGSLILVGA